MSLENMNCRLLRACELAYAIADNGQSFVDSKELNVKDTLGLIGFDPASLKIYQSPNDGEIDACYCGQTTDGAVILAFRGTLAPTLHPQSAKDFFRILKDWLNDGDIDQVPGENLAGLVHQGFLNSLNNLWPGIEGFGIAEAVQQQRPLYVTGHSKGGGLAFLAAYRLLETGAAPSGVCTFAAPRVGNPDFADAYDHALKDITRRFEYQDDIVPHLPPHTSTWRHVFKAGARLDAKAPQPAASARPGIVADFEELMQRLEELEQLGLPAYVSAGVLQFIDWAVPPGIEEESRHLHLQRELHLAKLLLTLQFERIIGDHSVSNGYSRGACGG